MPLRHRYTFGTFNTALARGAHPRVEERARAVADQLADVPADVLCLQEVWQSSEVESIRERVRHRFPYVFVPHAEPSRETGCTAAELDRAAACVDSRCGDVAETDRVACAARRCAFLAAELSAGCVACLTDDPSRSARAILDACRAGDDAGDARGGELEARKADDVHDIPTSGGDLGGHAYGGRYGLMLLSRWPLMDPRLRPLPGDYAARGVVEAYAALPSGTVAHVLCTHLAAAVGGVGERVRQAGSAAQASQIEHVLASLSPADDSLTVLMGDLNTGPGGPPSLRARQPQHFQMLLGAGFVLPSGFVGSCTLCDDNLFRGGAGDGGSFIDHVLVRSTRLFYPAAQRFLDRPLTLGDERLPLSDHYGLLVTVFDDGASGEPASGPGG